jgi:hypothetical protein
LVRKRISFSPYRYFIGYFSEEIITQLNFGKNPKSDSKFYGDSSVGRLIAAYADVGHDATAKLKFQDAIGGQRAAVAVGTGEWPGRVGADRDGYDLR